MSPRIRIVAAISGLSLPLALVACSGSSSSSPSSTTQSSAASTAPPAGDATYAATPPAGVLPITVVAKPSSVQQGSSAVLGIAGSPSLKGKIAYVVVVDKEVASEIWTEGKPLDANGVASFTLTSLYRTYDFQVVVPAAPLPGKEFPAGTKLVAESAVFPITVTGS